MFPTIVDRIPHELLAPICRQINRWFPTVCHFHTSCNRFALGYKHRGANCECHRVHYDTE